MSKRRLVFILLCAVALMVGVTIYLSPRDEPRKVDAIVAISGGDTDARVRRAVELYFNDWAPVLIFSGAALDPLSPSNAEVMREAALDLGVPPEAIEIEEQSFNTQQNADKTKEVIDKFQYDSIILVTSPYHQRRAYLEFRNRFGGSFEIVNVSAEDPDWSRSTWWQSARGWQLTLEESAKAPISLIRATF